MALCVSLILVGGRSSPNASLGDFQLNKLVKSLKNWCSSGSEVPGITRITPLMLGSSRAATGKAQGTVW